MQNNFQTPSKKQDSPKDSVAATLKKSAIRGRPKSKRSHQLNNEIIKVASELMLENGFEDASMDAIAEAAGVTKRTLYTRFGSKEGLLGAVLMNASIPTYESLHSENFDPSLNLQEQLVAMAIVFNDVLMQPKTQRWLQFVASGVARNPHLSTQYNQGFSEYYSYVERMLEAAFSMHSIKIKKVADKTRFFMSLIAAPAQKSAFFAIEPGTKEEQHNYITDAVRIFVQGCVLDKQFSLQPSSE